METYFQKMVLNFLDSDTIDDFKQDCSKEELQFIMGSRAMKEGEPSEEAICWLKSWFCHLYISRFGPVSTSLPHKQFYQRQNSFGKF